MLKGLPCGSCRCQVCSLCESEEGVCIQCSHPGCDTAYHVTCAMQKDLDMFMSVCASF